MELKKMKKILYYIIKKKKLFELKNKFLLKIVVIYIYIYIYFIFY